MNSRFIVFYGCLFIAVNTVPYLSAYEKPQEQSENHHHQENETHHHVNGKFKKILELLSNSTDSKTVILAPFMSNTTIYLEDFNFANLTKNLHSLKFKSGINFTHHENPSDKELQAILNLLAKQSGPVTIVPFITTSNLTLTNFNFGNVTQNFKTHIPAHKSGPSNGEHQKATPALNSTIKEILSLLEKNGLKIIPLIQNVTLSWGNFGFGDITQNITGYKKVQNLQTVSNVQTNYTLKGIKEALGDKPEGVLIVPLIQNSTIILDNFNFANVVQNKEGPHHHHHVPKPEAVKSEKKPEDKPEKKP